MARLDPSEYVALGRRAILEVLDTEHAAAWREIEAKVADRQWPGLGTRVDPHHLTTARMQLFRSGEIEEVYADTRGGREVGVVVPVVPRRKTAIAKAAQRKRLLLARYLGWAQGTLRSPGIIGPAAERVTHESFLAAAPHGYRLVQPAGGGVADFLGVHLRGPLDHAALFTPIDADGLPASPVAIPVEVKNLRDWLYPSSTEPYQLLEKAAALQNARPDVAVMPVLVCRRAHFTTFRMAKDLGFFIIETDRQFIPPSVDEQHLLEVRSELGFIDLVATATADERIVARLVRTLPAYALDRAQLWATTAASDAAEIFSDLRTSATGRQRTENLEILRDMADDAGLRENGGW